MKQARVAAISTHLPESTLPNEDLERDYDNFPADQILEKTGIRERRIADPTQCASDLAYAAAGKLFAENPIKREEIDALIFCSQTPDYFLPTTACLLQDRLGLNTTIAAMDINLGCSGFVYSLGLAKGLIETEQANSVLVLTADTYSKLLHREDRNVRSIFGDAAAATLVKAKESDTPLIGPFVYGTDGSGKSDLIVESGGFREQQKEPDRRPRLFMDGPKIFQFTMKSVPSLVGELLERSRLQLDDIDLFVFHQANQFMLDHLRKKIGIPEDRFLVAMESCGNTVSASIPLALEDADRAGKLHSGMRLMLVGFGVGFSWAATLVQWESDCSGATQGAMEPCIRG